MRAPLLGVLVTVLPSIALAQPAPPPPPVEATEATPQESTGLQLRAGLGFGRYTESGAGWKWASDLQPFAQFGAEFVTPAGRGQFVVQGAAGLGSDVHMEGSGQLTQENDFHQQIFEGSPRYRHPITPRLYFDAGYHLTVQRLFFTNIPMLGDARETVTVHAVEAGLGWRRVADDGSRKHFAFVFGLNRGSAENSRITGENFSASGQSVDIRVGKRWASGFQMEFEAAWRKQNGSGVADVFFDGMATQAMWPDNVTWNLLGVIGFAL